MSKRKSEITISNVPRNGYFTFSFFSFFMAHGSYQARGQIGAEAEATLDQSRICDVHHSLQERQILNPVREAKDQTASSRKLRRVFNQLSHNKNSLFHFFSFHPGYYLFRTPHYFMMNMLPFFHGINYTL